MNIIKNTNLQIAMATAGLAVMGGGLVAPILPLMITELGIAKESIGLVLIVFTIFVSIFTPILGGLSDQIGRKKVLVPVALLYGISGLLIFFTSNFTFILILRAIQGIGVAGMVTLAVTIIGDIFEGKERAQAMGLRTSAHSIGFAVIPFLSGAIAFFGWQYPFLLYGLSIFLGIWAMYKLKIPKIETNRNIKDYLKLVWGVMKNKKALSVFLSSFLVFIVLYILIIFIPILLTEKFALSPFYIGLAISIFFITSSLVSSFNGKLMERFKDYYLIVGGFLVTGLSLFLIPFVNSFLTIIILLIIWSIGHGISFPVINTLAAELTPTHLRAGVVSVVIMMTYIGATVSPVIFSPVMKEYGISWVFFGSALFALLPLAIVAIDHLLFGRKLDIIG